MPTYNDDLPTLERMFGWVRQHLGRDVPLHLARFVPEYRLKQLPRTPVATLEAARQAALAKGLRFVYLSNLAPHDGNHTYCPRCGSQLIERLGFKVIADYLRKGRCPHCRARIPGRWG